MRSDSVWGEAGKEVLGTVINGAIVYAQADLSFWACAFFGFVITTTFLNRARFDAVTKALRESKVDLADATEKIGLLENEIWLIRNRE
jgi:hypothetical protein